MAPAFTPNFGLTGPGVPRSKLHTPRALPRGVRFALCPLRSPLLRASLLVSLPPRTRMLRSRGFPFLTERSCEQEVLFGNPRITGSLRLPGAFRSLARPSSAPEPSHSPNSGVSRKTIGSAHVQAAYDRLTGPCPDEAHASPGISTLPLRRLAASRVHTRLPERKQGCHEGIALSPGSACLLVPSRYLTLLIWGRRPGPGPRSPGPSRGRRGRRRGSAGG